MFIIFILLHRAFFSQLKHNIQLVMVFVQQLKVIIKCFIILLVLTLLFSCVCVNVCTECPEAIFIMCFQSIYGVMIQAFMVIYNLSVCDE